jgi:hypothetical protein
MYTPVMFDFTTEDRYRSFFFQKKKFCQNYVELVSVQEHKKILKRQRVCNVSVTRTDPTCVGRDKS